MGGKEAAEIFYDPEKFKRKDAAPNRVMETLFGQNGVQALDGIAHQHRKATFMSMMSPEELQKLTDMARKQWEIALSKWVEMEKVILYEEAQEILCRTACQWAGVPVTEEEIKKLSDYLGAMYESPAALGLDHWKGRIARNRVEKWLGELIEMVRDGKIESS